MSPKAPFYRRSWFLAALVLLALLLRAAFILYCPHSAAPDEGSWRSAALDLAAGKGFTNIQRHPGYVFFLSAVFKVFGGASDTPVRLVQAALSSIQVLLAFLLARSLFKKEAVACLSAIFLALYPYAIFQTAYILSESFYSFLLVLFITLLYSLPEHKHRNAFAAAAGLVFGLAILTKSTVLLLTPFILLWFALNRLPYRAAAAFLLGASLCVLPWSAYNYRTFGKFVLVTMGGSYLFQANNLETLGLELETRRLKEVQWFTPEYKEIAKLPPVAADREYTRRSLEFMRRNPGTVFTLVKMRFVHFWRLYPITKSAVQRFAALFTSGLYIPLALIGLFLSAAEWRKTFLIWALVFTFNFVHLFFISTLRYRIPLDPFFLIFAAYTLTVFYGRFRRVPRREAEAGG